MKKKKKKKKFLLLLKTSRIIKLRLVKRERERDREVQNTIELSVYTRIIILFKMDWKSPKLNWVSQKLLGSFFFFFFCFLFLSHLSLEKLLVFPIFPFCRKGGGERPNLIITNQWNSFKLKSHSSQFESKRKRKRKKKFNSTSLSACWSYCKKTKNQILLFYFTSSWVSSRTIITYTIYIYTITMGGWGGRVKILLGRIRPNQLTNQPKC